MAGQRTAGASRSYGKGRWGGDCVATAPPRAGSAVTPPLPFLPKALSCEFWAPSFLRNVVSPSLLRWPRTHARQIVPSAVHSSSYSGIGDPPSRPHTDQDKLTQQETTGRVGRYTDMWPLIIPPTAVTRRTFVVPET